MILAKPVSDDEAYTGQNRTLLNSRYSHGDIYVSRYGLRIYPLLRNCEIRIRTYQIMRHYYTPTPTDEAGGFLIQLICPISFILGLLLILLGLWQYHKTLQYDDY